MDDHDIDRVTDDVVQFLRDPRAFGLEVGTGLLGGEFGPGNFVVALGFRLARPGQLAAAGEPCRSPDREDGTGQRGRPFIRKAEEVVGDTGVTQQQTDHGLEQGDPAGDDEEGHEVGPLVELAGETQGDQRVDG